MTVYVDPADQQTYTYGASTIFEIYIYTTTQAIDIVGPGQDCPGALPTPAPVAGWNPLASLGGLFGISSVTATPFDPYAPENNLSAAGSLPASGAVDSYPIVEAPAPLGEDGSPTYPAYPETDSVAFEAGPVPSDVDAGAPALAGPVPSGADAGVPTVAAAPLPFKRAVRAPRTIVARRGPAAVHARATPVV